MAYTLPSNKYKHLVSPGCMIASYMGEDDNGFQAEKVLKVEGDTVYTDCNEYFTDDYRKPEDNPNERIWDGVLFWDVVPQAA